MLRPALLACALCLVACGPSPEVGPGEGAHAGEDGVSASGPSAHVTGMTVWTAPTMVTDFRYQQTVWVLPMRASKDLGSVFSYAADDEMGEALLTSKRKFEVVLDGGVMGHMARGQRLYVEMQAATAAQTKYWLSIVLAPRFTGFAGSSKIFLQTAIDPFVVGDEVVFRGAAKLGSGVHDLVIDAGGAEPTWAGSSGPTRYFDWNAAGLVAAADPPTDPVVLTADRPSGPVVKQAGIEVAVASLELWTTPPSFEDLEWTCSGSVLECLEGLAPGALDTSSCGRAMDVLPCAALLDNP